jgi:phosphomannomutase
MKLLKIGISGVRGIVGETITPELIMNFACAFGTWLGGGRVLVARDTRTSGPMLHSASLAALMSVGCDVLDLGICPTPILQSLVGTYKARGGISITAGHNGTAWNALVFVNSDGTYLNAFQGEEVLDIFHLGRFRKASLSRLGGVKRSEDGPESYFRRLSGRLDIKAIASAGLKVVIDPCNGAGAGIVDMFARALGIELVPVNNEPSGFFPHDPEPRPRNAAEAASVVRISGADAGFLVNSDVSRVSVVAEDGETLSEEYTFPLAAGARLGRDPGPVVTNASTSRMIEDVAAAFGRPVIRTRVGQSHIVQALLSEDAAIGGEGSGGVAVRSFQPAFDGFLAMGLILETMATEKQKLSELVRRLPKYHIVKEKIYCPPSRVHAVLAGVEKLFVGENPSFADGIKVERADGWIHVRASGTEPMIRVITENVSREKAEEDLERVAAQVARIV